MLFLCLCHVDSKGRHGLLRITAILWNIEVLGFFRSVLVKQILNQKIQVAYIVFLKYVILKEKTLEDIFKD